MPNLVRTGTAAVIGLGSGAIDGGLIAPIILVPADTTKKTPEQTLSVAVILEAVAAVGGAGLQLMAPFTVPSVADGLVDAGVALLARRGAEHVVKESKKPVAKSYALPESYGQNYAVPALMPAASVAGYLSPAYTASPQIGSISRVPKTSLR